MRSKFPQATEVNGTPAEKQKYACNRKGREPRAYMRKDEHGNIDCNCPGHDNRKDQILDKEHDDPLAAA